MRRGGGRSRGCCFVGDVVVVVLVGGYEGFDGGFSFLFDEVVHGRQMVFS